VNTASSVLLSSPENSQDPTMTFALQINKSLSCELYIGGADVTSFKLFKERNKDLLIVAARLRELTNSLISTISFLKNPHENTWKYVL